MEIYLLRHGEAGKRAAAPAKDQERALTALGRREIEEIGEAMAKRGYKFDAVLTSPLKRAKETAAIVTRTLKRKTTLEEWPELSPEGNRDAFYRKLAKIRPGSSVLVVGHEPYLTTAIGEIVGRGGEGQAGMRIVLKKGGLAKLYVTGFTPRVTGELRWLLTPKQIRKLA